MALSNATIAHEYARSLRFEGGEAAQTLLAFEEATRSYWRYAHGFWTLQSQDDLNKAVRHYMMGVGNQLGERALTSVTMDKIRDVVEQLAYEVDRYDVLEDGWLCFQDGSFNPDTGEFSPHSPERFSTIRVNALYLNPPRREDSPLFFKFLSEVCVYADGKHFQGMEDLIQEMYGFCLLASSERHLAFFLTGDGRNGKGVMAGILRAVIGKNRVSSLSLAELTTDKFGTAGLIGMRLNIADELNVHKTATSSIFKKLIAVDPIQLQRKYEQSFSHKPRAKFIFIVNGIPTFDGFDFALRERIICIPFFRSFSEDERDYALRDKIIAKELPGVVLWAMEGLRRLQANRLKFSVTEESKIVLNQFEDASMSVAFFFRENFEKVTDLTQPGFPTNTFFTEFRAWCEATGRKPIAVVRINLEMQQLAGYTRRGRNEAGVVVPCWMIRRKEKVP